LTRAEIYHRALTTIREAPGPDIYLLGCGAPQLAFAGLVDGMRIGPDGWGMNGFENVAARNFEAGKWWINDPDALIGTERPLAEYRAWASLDSLSGSVLTLGDDFDYFSSSPAKS
jgi:alpha-galactosidase